MSRIRRCIVACLLALVLMISAISVGIADDNKNQTLDQARAFVYANGNSKYYYSFGEFMYINILKEPEKYFMCMNAKEDIGETSANMAIVYDYMMNGELSDIGEYAQLALFEKLIILNILASYTEYTYPDEISIAGNFSEYLDELNDAFSATNNVNDIWALISDTKGLLPEDIPSDALDIVVDFASEGGDWLKATGEYLCAYQYRENYITMINDMLDVCSDKYISIALRDILDLLEQSDASIGMKQLMQQGAANISYNIVMTICEEALSSIPFINVVTTVRDLSGYIINNTIFNFSEYNVRVRTVDVLKRFEIALVEAARNANSAYYNDPTPENASRVCFMFDMVYRTLLCDMDVFEEFAELWDENKYNGLPQNVDFMRNSIKASYQNVQNIDFESIMAIQNTEIPSIPVIDEDYKFVDEVYADLDGDAQDELVVLYKVFDEIGPDRVEIYHMAICIFEDDNVLSAAYELPRTDVEQDFKAYLVPNGVRQRLFIASGDDNIYSADFCLIGYWDEQMGEIVHLSRTNNIGVEIMNLYTFPDDETVQLAYVDTYENDNGITQSRYISELENAFAKFGIVFQTSGERNAEAVLPDDTLVFSYSNANDVQTNDSDIIDDDNATIAYGYVYTIGNVNMRTEPDLDASIMHTIPKDTRVEYTGSDAVDERGVRWFCVYHDGKTGWISSRYSTFAQDGTSSDEVQMPESSEVNDAYSLLNEEFADLDGDGQYERLVLYRVLDERLDDGFEIYHLAIHIFEEGDVLSAEYNLQQAGYSYDMLAYLVPDGARQRLFIESKTIEVEAPTARYCLIGYWDERISEELTVVDPGYTDADYLGLITSPAVRKRSLFTLTIMTIQRE